METQLTVTAPCLRVAPPGLTAGNQSHRPLLKRELARSGLIAPAERRHGPAWRKRAAAFSTLLDSGQQSEGQIYRPVRA